MNHNKKESVGGQLEDSQSTSEYFVLKKNDKIVFTLYQVTKSDSKWKVYIFRWLYR